MMKSALEAALAEELTDRLGYEHGDRGSRGSGDSREHAEDAAHRNGAGEQPVGGRS